MEASIQETLSSEVIRKLRLATEAETKEDREIICEEVFCDITGTLDAHAQARLQAPHHCCFYEVLARYYHESAGDTAHALMYLCQKLWGQGYAAPIYTLLLHRWLLLRKGGSGWEQRIKHLNVLVLGARQLFLGDVQSGLQKFIGLYHFLSNEMVLGSGYEYIAGLPVSSRSSLMSAVASVVPYYASDAAMVDMLARFPHPSAGLMPPRALKKSPEKPNSPTSTPSPTSSTSPMSAADAAKARAATINALEDAQGTSASSAAPQSLDIGSSSRGAGGGAGRGGTGGEQGTAGREVSSAAVPAPRRALVVPGSGADFLVCEFTEFLGKIRSEAGLLKYLRTLCALKNCRYFRTLSPITKLRLQSELYSLTSPGGPHYPPRSVQSAAMLTLDTLFPLGKSMRRFVRFLFRILHPTDWLGEFWLAPVRWWTWLYGKIVLAVFYTLYRLVVWRPARGSTG